MGTCDMASTGHIQLHREKCSRLPFLFHPGITISHEIRVIFCLPGHSECPHAPKTAILGQYFERKHVVLILKTYTLAKIPRDLENCKEKTQKLGFWTCGRI